MDHNPKRFSGASNVLEDEFEFSDKNNDEIDMNMQSIIDNTKNEFDCMKVSLERNQKEIESIKRAFSNKDKIQLQEIGNIKNELREKNIKILELERKLEAEKSERLIEEERRHESFTWLTSELESRIYTLEGRNTGLESQLNQLKNERMDWKRETGINLTTVKSQFETKLTDLVTMNLNLERKLILYTNYKKLCPSIDVGYIWRFKDISVDTQQSSQVFYSNDYAMFLLFNINDDKIALWCYIVKGNNDQGLVWPIRDRITLSIVDQESMEDYKSDTYQYETYPQRYKCAFNRSLDGANRHGIGSHSFVRYSTISLLPSVVVDDSIVVTCKFEYQHTAQVAQYAPRRQRRYRSEDESNNEQDNGCVCS